MAWITIIGTNLEYDNNPADPGGAQSILWAKQTNGIRSNIFDSTEIYTKCRIIGTTVDTFGELNKTYYDNI